MKGGKRKCPCTRGGVSTRSRKVNSNGNEPVGEEVVHEESSPVRDTSVVSLLVESESENMSGVSSQERQPLQPLEFYFKSTEYTKTCKIQTKCYVSKTMDVIKKLKVEDKWFTNHPQFRMWMLLMRTICIEEEDVAWFAVNGVPIRYSMREHALISGLDCHEYTRSYLKLRSTKFVDFYFGGEEEITIKDVEQKLLSMKPCNDRLKMAVLFFLGRVIRGKTKDTGPLDPFILRIVDDLEVCRTFPWGRLTFEDAIKKIKHVMELLKGEVHDACGFPGFVTPLEVLAFECIPRLGKTFRLFSDSPCEDCPRMCKSRFTKSSMRGYPVEDIYVALGKTKKKIWWKELYVSDIAARVFTKKKEKEKITLLEGSSSTSGLECSLNGLEERLLKSMKQGFSSLNSTVERKLEAMNSRMIVIEKNQRILRKTAKKIERMLSFIESKGKEANIDDFDIGWWADYSRGDYGGGSGSKENRKRGKNEEAENLKEKNREADNSESDNGEKKTVSSEEENETERRRVEADAAWRRILSESKNNEGKDDEENGSDCGRRSCGKTTIEKKEVVAKITVEEEEETVVEAETVVEDTVKEEEETEAVVETTKVEAGSVVETTEVEVEAVDDGKYTEAEKQMWYMVVYKSSEKMPCESKVPTRPKIHARPKVMAVKGGIPIAERLAKMKKAQAKKKAESDGTPKKRGRLKNGKTEGTLKKRGRPKKEVATLVACTPKEKKKPQWLQSPFTDVNNTQIDGVLFPLYQL
ncbi:hypothetical protein N665_0575s0008 [Sinapis alba]|nr:hypothetical protein N665_0575s0008 [Sinapis alba]